MAMFADMAAYGGDWLVGHSYPFHLAPHGGRKTTGYAYTEPLTVLYNGPRRYVALSVTHLYDWFDSDQDGIVDHPDETWPIVDVILTFIFEKVKKQVIIFKDIKQVITGKELESLHSTYSSATGRSGTLARRRAMEATPTSSTKNLQHAMVLNGTLRPV